MGGENDGIGGRVFVGRTRRSSERTFKKMEILTPGGEKKRKLFKNRTRVKKHGQKGEGRV
jgi:hypothetical protein